MGLLLGAAQRPERWQAVVDGTPWHRVMAWIVVTGLAAVVGLLLGRGSPELLAGVVVSVLVALFVALRFATLREGDGLPRRWFDRW